MAGKSDGFVSLKSLTHGAPAPADALAEIRRIYFRTTPKTIGNDLSHAIELLKSLPDEDTRDRAAVYMDGLAQMRGEWAGAKKPKGRETVRRESGKKTSGGTRKATAAKAEAPRADRGKRKPR